MGGIWIVCVVVGATREAAGFERTFIHVHARLLSVPWLRHALRCSVPRMGALKASGDADLPCSSRLCCQCSDCL